MNNQINSLAKIKLEAAKKEVDSIKLNHPFLEGKVKEIALNKILTPFLPKHYGVGTGKLCDSKSFLSTEIDLIIYTNELIQPFIFEYNLGLYPVESVLTCIEVKSTLTKTRLKTSYQNFKEIKDKIYIAPGEFGENDQNKETRPFLPTFELFAFESNITSKTNYSAKEFERYKEIDENWETNPVIRSICIIDKGWWIFWKNKWHFHPANGNKKETISYLANSINTLSKIETSRGIPRVGEYLTDINDLTEM